MFASPLMSAASSPQLSFQPAAAGGVVPTFVSLGAAAKSGYQLHSAFHSPLLQASNHASSAAATPLSLSLSYRSPERELSEFSSPLSHPLHSSSSKRFSDSDDISDDFDSELFECSSGSFMLENGVRGVQFHNGKQQQQQAEEAALPSIYSFLSAANEKQDATMGVMAAPTAVVAVVTNPPVDLQRLKVISPSEQELAQQQTIVQRRLSQASIPALQRSQSECALIAPASSTRPAGTLSRFHLPPPIDTTAAVATSDSAASKHAAASLTSPAVNPFTRFQVEPSTPVPVGTQWMHLSRQPHLHHACMQHFEVVDEARERVLARIHTLAKEIGMPAEHVNTLVQIVQHK